jgi:drug/metabolite transporter (DMT)-like permease
VPGLTSRVALTTLTMLAFAGNSLLCRAALRHTSLDEASFTSIRLISGAVTLALIVRARSGNTTGRNAGSGNWLSALLLFVYAAALSFAYVGLAAGTGALLLFGAVQVTMIGHGLAKGERLRNVQLLGLALASGGLVWLLLPGISAPPLHSALLMLLSGAAWGWYSLRGRGRGDAIRVTAGNFMRAAFLAAGLSAVMVSHVSLDATGILYAILSGALTSGAGYSIWYTVLPSLKATTAATVQLSVPVIVSLGGILLLGEPLTARFALASAATLGGIALVILKRR